MIADGGGVGQAYAYLAARGRLELNRKYTTRQRPAVRVADYSDKPAAHNADSFDAKKTLARLGQRLGSYAVLARGVWRRCLVLTNNPNPNIPDKRSVNVPGSGVAGAELHVPEL